MSIIKQNKNTWLFIGFLLAAAIANVLSKSLDPVLSSLMTTLNYVILTGLLLFWIESVRERLLPTSAKNTVLCAAFLMLLYMLLRIFRYRFAVEPMVMRHVIYAYWIPQMLIPALFLITCIRIRRGDLKEHDGQNGQDEKKEPNLQDHPTNRENLLLIPAALLACIALTSDLHRLVYVPKIDILSFSVESGTYTYGPVFYLMCAWMILTFSSGLLLLIRETGHISKEAIRDLMLVVASWFGIIMLNLLYMGLYTSIRRPFNVPEAHTFGLLGIFEMCIRYRLIPSNENYPGFFRVLHLPALITDREYRPVYRSELAGAPNYGDLAAGQTGDSRADQIEGRRADQIEGRRADQRADLVADLAEAPRTENDADLRETLEAALSAPVALPQDQKLHGKKIRAGYAFWTTDESGIRRAQERLREANETIEQENDLIRAETEQKEKDAYLQSRHRIYHEIAENLYPVQKRISQLLDSARPGAGNFRETISEADANSFRETISEPDAGSFRETIAKVSVLNAYVKRKTNLLLLAAERDRLRIGELALALNESANYLTLAGLQTTAQIPEDEELSAYRIVMLYDAFENLAEQLLGRAPSLMVSWNDQGLRLAAETDLNPETGEIALPVSIRRNDDILYIEVSSGKEAAV